MHRLAGLACVLTLFAACSDDPVVVPADVDLDAVDTDAGDSSLDADTDAELDAPPDGDRPDVVDPDGDLPDTLPDVRPDTPPDATEPDADVGIDADADLDTDPDVIEAEVCEVTAVGQLNGSTAAGDANGGRPRFEPWDPGYDAGLLGLFVALQVSAGEPTEGEWDVVDATVTATEFRSGDTDRAQQHFWLQDGRASFEVFLANPDADGAAPFPIQVGQRVSFTATRLAVFRGRAQINVIDGDSWTLESSDNEVYVATGIDASLFSFGRVVRATGRLVEVTTPDCGSGTTCYRLSSGSGLSTILRTREDGLDVGDCVSFVGPISSDLDEQPQLDALNFDWTEVTCDGLSDSALLDSPCEIGCDPVAGDACDDLDGTPATCALGPNGFRCEPAGEDVLGGACEATADCAPGLSCWVGECTEFCEVSEDADDCPSGRSCVGVAGTDGVGICARPCDGFAGADDCGTGFACRPLAGGGEPESGICGRTRGAAEGDACTADLDCAEGYVCSGSTTDATTVCTLHCDTLAEDPHAVCGADGTCFPRNPDAGLGVCLDGCELGSVRNACIDIEGAETCLPVSEDRGACVGRGDVDTGDACDPEESFGECTGVCIGSADGEGTCRDICRTFASRSGYSSGCRDDEICSIRGANWGTCQEFTGPAIELFGPCASPGSPCAEDAICLTVDAAGNALCLPICRLGLDDCRDITLSDDATGCQDVLSSRELGICLP